MKSIKELIKQKRDSVILLIIPLLHSETIIVLEITMCVITAIVPVIFFNFFTYLTQQVHCQSRDAIKYSSHAESRGSPFGLGNQSIDGGFDWQ